MILVTGGAGYIGSHTVRLLLSRGFEVVIFDNLSRGNKESLPTGVPFENVDLLDYQGLVNCIKKYDIDSVIHFAAFAYVGESMENPQMYYQNNVVGSYNLITAAKECGIKYFVFSSTCSIYGNPEKVPMSEDLQVNPINPYARTKLMIENMLEDYRMAFGIEYIALRYFNAAGDSENGEIGESHDPEPHVIPLIMYAALGIRESIKIFGDDYPTPDGTCIRDYIHIVDLADAHIRALEYLAGGGFSQVINLGTGNGYSVKEIVDVSRKITGINIKADITPRRPGDPAVLVADNKKAKEILGWIPKYDLEGIIKTAWNWHKNPKF